MMTASCLMRRLQAEGPRGICLVDTAPIHRGIGSVAGRGFGAIRPHPWPVGKRRQNDGWRRHVARNKVTYPYLTLFPL
jgi:hypothetical protein